MSARNGGPNGGGPPDRRRVAVTGLGGVTPVGAGKDEIWANLLAGRSGIRAIDAYETDGHRVRIAGQVRDFDPADYLSMKIVKRLDRFAHFALAASGMAVEDARFEPERRERVGTVMATGIGGAATAERGFHEMVAKGPNRISPLFVPATIPNMAAGAVAMQHGFGGPNTCPVTACAASADAVGTGFRMVRDGYADACLVGGAEAAIRPGVIGGFANIRALSERNDEPEAASRPFDESRDGFVLSEGAAALMLEPLDAALERGATVYAEIAGYGQSADAFHETAPDPDGAAPARAITAALEDAGERPEDVDYVNAHATSTPKADVMETKALKLALGERARDIPISSTKSMTGHMLGAAGAIESIAAALSLKEGRVPPTINYSEPDPECDLDYVPNEAREADLDVALSNSMGFGGHNVCLVFRRQ